jgi:hypothetical protein
MKSNMKLTALLLLAVGIIASGVFGACDNSIE